MKAESCKQEMSTIIKKRQGGHNSEKQQANQVSEVSLNFKGKEAIEKSVQNFPDYMVIC